MRKPRTRCGQAVIGTLLIALVCVGLPSAAGAANPWVRVAAPNPGGETNSLLSVSCATETTCTAVGYYVGTGGVRPLIVRTTNGTTWVRATPPTTGSQLAQLHDVSCTSPTDCTAVGTYSDGVVNGELHFATLVYRTTNGTGWQRVQSPNPNGFSSILWGVSCLAPTKCRAVGDAEGNSLVLRTSNGTNWFRQPTPNRGAGANYLISVDCVTQANCVAVGFYYATPTETAKTKTLVLRTTGGPTWVVASSPNPSPATSDNFLNYVSCVAPSTCHAVGGVDPITTPVKRAFILRTTNNGSLWSRSATPTIAGDSDLRGVSCQSATECTAVGIQWNAGHTTFSGAILRTTNGTSWTSPSPAAEIAGRDIVGVSCATPAKCFGVGGFDLTGDPDASQRTLVLRET
jgi:hypothetical protein